MSDGRSHKENAPSPGPICARPKLTRSARELRASASPPSATRASVSRATPPLPEAAPAPPLWPPAREPASRPGPRLSSCSPPPRLQRGARAHSRPQTGREVPGEPRGPAPTKAGSTPAGESARGHGEPVPAASLVPAAEPPRRPHSAPSRRPATPRREARRKGAAPATHLDLEVGQAERRAKERAEVRDGRDFPPGAELAQPGRAAFLRAHLPAALARSLSLARSDSGRRQRLSLSARRLPPLGVSSSGGAAGRGAAGRLAQAAAARAAGGGRALAPSRRGRAAAPNPIQYNPLSAEENRWGWGWGGGPAEAWGRGRPRGGGGAGAHHNNNPAPTPARTAAPRAGEGERASRARGGAARDAEGPARSPRAAGRVGAALCRAGVWGRGVRRLW